MDSNALPCINLSTNTFYSIEGVIAANKSAGNHFFDKEARRSFGSRIGDCLYSGRLFVTSEQDRYGTDPRKYTIRFIDNDARISTIGAYQEFNTAGAARACIKRIVSNGCFWGVGYADESGEPRPIWYFETLLDAQQKLSVVEAGNQIIVRMHLG